MSTSVKWGDWSWIFRDLQLNADSTDASSYHGCKVFAAYSRQEEDTDYKEGTGNWYVWHGDFKTSTHISGSVETLISDYSGKRKLGKNVGRRQIIC